MFRNTFITSFFLQMLIYSILSCEIQDRFRCNSNCSGYYICSSGIDDMYTCSGGQRCNMIKQNCSSEVSSCGPDGYHFQCSSEGLYPDPYDCTKYYICGPSPGHSLYDPESGEDGTDFRHSCPDGLAYNPGSTVCDFNLTADVCKHGPVPECNILYQTEALATNQSIFYICISIGNGVLIPQLFRCDSGYYNSTTCKCSDSNFFLENNFVDPCFANDTQTTTFTSVVTDESTDYTTETLSTTSGSTTEQQTTSDTTISEASTIISSSDQTTTTGNGIDSTTNEETTTIPISSTVSSTEETESTLPPTEGTTSTLSPTESSTPEETSTILSTESSTEGTTSTVLSTESSTVEGTTSTALSTEGTTSTLSPTEETTSTLSPTTTTISSSETESTTSEPPEFTCLSPGIFPDPYDCHYFYICDVFLNSFHYICPEGSHFDTRTSECEEGDECSPLSTQTTGTVTTTTGETSTHAPFHCDSPGIFPDCYDCHAFYRCTVTGHMFHEHCPIGSYFDQNVSDCVVGENCPNVIC